MKEVFIIPILLSGALTGNAQSIAQLTGDWQGNLVGLTLTAHLQETPTGELSGTLDIPAQKAQSLPLAISAVQDSVFFTLAIAHARFAGIRAPGGQVLIGTWYQNGKTLPLLFGRILADGRVAGPERPQTPHEPYPYQALEVTFTNELAGISLAGTFTKPVGRGPFPAVALLTGSGPEDRDETLFGHKLFAVLADYLTRRGVAVLRFDDRGVGKSGGTLKGTTSADYASDARAALSWLRSQPVVKTKHAGLIGHSEGGTAAMLAAGATSGAPDFIILLAAPGIPGIELITQQVVAVARLQTADTVALRKLAVRERELLRTVSQNPDNQEAQAKLTPLLEASGINSANASRAAEQLTSPSYRAILADNPSQDLRSVRCPVLAINGSKDVQVAAAPNLAGIQDGLRRAGNKDVLTLQLPGLNHLFQTAATGSVSEYATLEETCSPAALQVIGDWLARHTR